MGILAAWDKAASYIASGHESEFSGRRKEGLVFRRFRQNIENLSPGIEVELEVPFDCWKIDLVGRAFGCREEVQAPKRRGCIRQQKDRKDPEAARCAAMILREKAVVGIEDLRPANIH